MCDTCKLIAVLSGGRPPWMSGINLHSFRSLQAKAVGIVWY
jgi:hypothetical protein